MKKGGIYLAHVTNPKALAKLEFYLVIIKRIPGRKSLVYKIDDKKKGIRLSNEYIALVKEQGKANWGWFFIDNGKVVSELPNINKVLDSIRSTFSKRFL
ncbi:hypothetical protein A3860_13090 [Niastella vici]|uniref:Uncharacterized protein n=1 Tax=Niastella vici TaxID=1703345 RepID=A0A1V9G6Z4_9BACT|nr:hypothetical protein [Niastella vici]OQP66421.1 hypothetical protein A3860_13090 [Niastella vici]